MLFRLKYAKDTAKALTTTGMQLRFLYPFQIQLSTLFLHTSVKLLYFKGFDSIFMWKIMHTCTCKLVSCITFSKIFFLGANIECVYKLLHVYATLFIYGKHLVSWQWRPSTPSWFDTQLFFNITGACQERTSLNRFLMGTVSHTRESRQGLSIIHCESAKWFSFS